MPANEVTHINTQKAWDLLQKEPRVAFIDVRSDMEYLFIGHPAGAVNTPWISEPDWEINPNFVREVRKLILGGNNRFTRASFGACVAHLPQW